MANSVQSVQRALDILEAVAATPQGLKLKTIADTLGLKSPTAHHLANTLLARGYLRKNGHGLYAMGHRVDQLARKNAPVLAGLAKPLLLAMAENTPGASMVLGEFTEGEVRATVEIIGARPRVIERTTARAMHPYASASALSFQAYLSEERLAEYRLRYPFSEFAHRLWPDLPTLEDFLAKARKNGVLSVVFPHENILKVAVPVMTPAESVVGVIAASKRQKGRTKANDLASQLTHIANTLSESLRSQTRSS